MTYNAFDGAIWEVEKLVWFDGWLITKTNKLVGTKMARTLIDGKETKCVVVLYDDISTKNKSNLGKYVLIGPKQWFTNKAEAQSALKTLKEEEKKNGKNNKSND